MNKTAGIRMVINLMGYRNKIKNNNIKTQSLLPDRGKKRK